MRICCVVCHRSWDDALQMLERETAREKNLEKAQKEAKVRARKTTIAVVAPAAPDDPHELPAAAAEAEVEAEPDTSDDLAQVPDILPPFVTRSLPACLDELNKQAKNKGYRLAS